MNERQSNSRKCTWWLYSTVWIKSYWITKSPISILSLSSTSWANSVTFANGSGGITQSPNSSKELIQLPMNFILNQSVQQREWTTESTNPLESIIMRAWFAHHHTGILLRIECNRNIFVITFLPFRCNLLNEHLADFAFFPVGDVGVDLIHLVSAHTIGTLSRPQVTNCHHSNLLLWWNNEGTCKSSHTSWKLMFTIRA